MGPLCPIRFEHAPTGVIPAGVSALGAYDYPAPRTFLGYVREGACNLRGFPISLIPIDEEDPLAMPTLDAAFLPEAWRRRTTIRRMRKPQPTEGPKARISLRAQSVLPDKPAKDYEYDDYDDDCAE
jgi:hypothetical protein